MIVLQQIFTLQGVILEEKEIPIIGNYIVMGDSGEKRRTQLPFYQLKRANSIRDLRNPQLRRFIERENIQLFLSTLLIFRDELRSNNVLDATLSTNKNDPQVDNNDAKIFEPSVIMPQSQLASAIDENENRASNRSLDDQNMNTLDTFNPILLADHESSVGRETIAPLIHNSKFNIIDSRNNSPNKNTEESNNQIAYDENHPEINEINIENPEESTKDHLHNSNELFLENRPTSETETRTFTQVTETVDSGLEAYVEIEIKEAPDREPNENSITQSFNLLPETFQQSHTTQIKIELEEISNVLSPIKYTNEEANENIAPVESPIPRTDCKILETINQTNTCKDIILHSRIIAYLNEENDHESKHETMETAKQTENTTGIEPCTIISQLGNRDIKNEERNEISNSLSPNSERETIIDMTFEEKFNDQLEINAERETLVDLILEEDRLLMEREEYNNSTMPPTKEISNDNQNTETVNLSRHVFQENSFAESEAQEEALNEPFAIINVDRIECASFGTETQTTLPGIKF